jgi:predicted N-acyltransferase
MSSNEATEVEIHEGVSSFDAAEWDHLVGSAPPFVEYAFLHGLEVTGCVGEGTGWMPAFIGVRRIRDRLLLGAAPAYLKLHSMGEFVYDWSWAEAASRMGIRYYPKLLIGIPFTPVGGPRLLVAPELDADDAKAVARTLLGAALTLAEEKGCSGVHCVFCTRQEVEIGREMGFIHRLGLQFHWHNEGYKTFDDFLARFRSKRRNQIRRERRRVLEQGLQVLSFAGDELEDELELEEIVFPLYASTVDRYIGSGRYLNEAFFKILWQTMRSRLQLLVAREVKSSRCVAGSINFQKDNRRYGRYWGIFGHHPFVHFEICAYGAVEDCVKRGIETMEAGAGGGMHKYGRGFSPTYTHSMHWVFDHRFQQIARDFCQREANMLKRESAVLANDLFRK